MFRFLCGLMLLLTGMLLVPAQGFASGTWNKLLRVPADTDTFKFEEMVLPVDVATDSDGNVYRIEGVSSTSIGAIKKYNSSGELLLSFGTYGSGEGQLALPQGLCVRNYVYVADTGNNRIVQYDRDGNFVAQWGSRGSGDGQLSSPTGVAVDYDAYLYVVDKGNNRIEKFDIAQKSYYGQWNGSESSSGALSGPTRIAVDRDGDWKVYVLDSGNYRVVKYDANGQNTLTVFGGNGTGDGKFTYPQALAVDSKHAVYVLEGPVYYMSFVPSSTRVQKFDADGNYVTQWGSQGNLDGQFNYPSGIATSVDGKVYVADYFNYRLQIFGLSGDLKNIWGQYSGEAGRFGHLGAGFYLGNAGGCLAMLGDGTFYVADYTNKRVQAFSSDGTLKYKWDIQSPNAGYRATPAGIALDTVGLNSTGYVYVTDRDYNRVLKYTRDGTLVKTWGSSGSGSGQFSGVFAIAASDLYGVYVTELGNKRVQHFTCDGTHLATWDTTFTYPVAIVLDATGHVYVADAGDNTVTRYNSDGTKIASWGGTGTTAGKFKAISGLMIDAFGRVHVTDQFVKSVQVFDASGNYLLSYTPLQDQYDSAVAIARDYSDRIAVVSTDGHVVVGKTDIQNPQDILPVMGLLLMQAQ